MSESIKNREIAKVSTTKTCSALQLLWEGRGEKHRFEIEIDLISMIVRYHSQSDNEFIEISFSGRLHDVVSALGGAFMHSPKCFVRMIFSWIDNSLQVEAKPLHLARLESTTILQNILRVNIIMEERSMPFENPKWKWGRQQKVGWEKKSVGRRKIYSIHFFLTLYCLFEEDEG